MKFKIIISDLDGTLLNKFNRISKKNIFSIGKYIRNGGNFIFATGRSIVSTKKLIDKIELATQKKMKYVVCFNGAYIKDFENNQLITKTIDNQTVQEINDYAKANKLNLWMYTVHSTENGAVCARGKTTKIVAKFFKNLKVMKPTKKSDLTSYKINLLSWSTKKIEKTIDELTKKFPDKISICHTHRRMIEINAFGINKGYAVKELIKKTGINAQEIMAIGDSNNDYSMFQNVGKSVALKTKSKKLKEISTHLIDRKKDGVSIAIEKYAMSNNGPIKLIAVDLDGTLLENDSKLTNITVKQTIQKAVNDYKIPFALATGRSLDDCLIVLNDLELNPEVRQFIIASNGALVYDVNKQEYLFSRTIEQKTAEKLFQKIKKANGSPAYGTTGAIIYNRSSNTMHIGKKIIDEEPRLEPFYGTNHKFVLSCLTKNCPNFTRNSWAPKKSIEIENLEDVNKIVKFVLYFEDTDKRNLFLNELKEIGNGVEVAITSKRNIEVTAANVNKGIGLKVVSTKLDIDLNETLPIGDEGNDIEMLKLSKHSVTLASSRDEVKKSASIIYDEKPSFIVAKAINELILKN